MSPERAANLLRDGEFVDELNSIKKWFVDRLINTGDQEVDVRENCYRMIRAVDLVISHFQAIAETTEIKSKRWKIL